MSWLQVPVMFRHDRTMAPARGQTAKRCHCDACELLSLGLNCATGPEFMTDHVRSLAGLTENRVSSIPNAGLPNEDGIYLETPETFSATIERFVDHGWINLVGGCCGTTAAHIRALAQMVEGKPPRVPAKTSSDFVLGDDLSKPRTDQRPLIVRASAPTESGSRKFKRLINEEKYEEAAEIARQQVKSGAQICDVNLQKPTLEERYDVDPSTKNDPRGQSTIMVTPPTGRH